MAHPYGGIEESLRQGLHKTGRGPAEVVRLDPHEVRRGKSSHRFQDLKRETCLPGTVATCFSPSSLVPVTPWLDPAGIQKLRACQCDADRAALGARSRA